MNEMMRLLIYKAVRYGICVSLILAVSMLGTFSIVSYAKDEAKEQAKKKEKALSPEERNKLENKAKEELNGTVWEIRLTEMVSGDTTKAKKDEKDDTLYFEDFRIRAAGMADNGFNPSNYSIRLKGKENEIIVWETMQTSEDEAKGVAFWRGQFEKGTKSMRGVLSWQISENKKADYSFKGTQKEIVAEVKPQGQPAGEVATPGVEEVVATGAAPVKTMMEAVKEAKPPVQAEAVKAGLVEQKAVQQEAKPRPKWKFWRK